LWGQPTVRQLLLVCFRRLGLAFWRISGRRDSPQSSQRFRFTEELLVRLWWAFQRAGQPTFTSWCTSLLAFASLQFLAGKHTFADGDLNPSLPALARRTPLNFVCSLCALLRLLRALSIFLLVRKLLIVELQKSDCKTWLRTSFHRTVPTDVHLPRFLLAFILFTTIKPVLL
jgi:hypothetical protein